jgi:hypothetical protein
MQDTVLGLMQSSVLVFMQYGVSEFMSSIVLGFIQGSVKINYLIIYFLGSSKLILRIESYY